ncbi:MAG: L-serine ammonia-lyase, iron-sulfur-dependent, subunit alpha [Bacteroidetes bacterium]|nr:L-serine ammonia-lyase, iron-sulfur-dependent, subunit alpha [Bacteroidota bacterium]
MAVSFNSTKVNSVVLAARRMPCMASRRRFLDESPVGTWCDHRNQSIVGDANIFGQLIPGRVWGGGIPIISWQKDIQASLATIAHILVSAPEFDKRTTEKEKMRAALLIAECHRSVMAEDEEVRNTDKSRTMKFIAETMDSDNGLTLAYRDIPGAFERLFGELHGRNYEVRFMRNFTFRNGNGKALDGQTYAVSFISSEDFASTDEEKACRKEKEKVLQEKQNLVLNETIRITSEKSIGEDGKQIGAGGIRGLVDQYFKQIPTEILLRQNPKKLAEQIKRFFGIKERISIIGGLEEKSTSNSQKIEKAKVRIGIKDRHLTKWLAKICEIMTAEEVDIEYLIIESLEEEGKSIATFSLRDKKGQPINTAKFEELKRRVMDLVEKGIGRTSLVDNIIGPAMIPTSSSHTCGANRIARTVRNLIAAGFEAGFLDSDSTYGLKVQMTNTFALDKNGSGKGHYSDEAVIAGLLDIHHDDAKLIPAKDAPEIKNITIGAKEIAFGGFINKQDKSMGRNTIKFILSATGSDGKTIMYEFTGDSPGASNIELLEIFGDDCKLQKQLEPIRGNTPTYLISLGEKSPKNIKEYFDVLGYRIINDSTANENHAKNGRMVICLDKKLSEGAKVKINGIVKKMAEVDLIAEPLVTFEPDFRDFASLLEKATREDKSISQIAIDYEARIKGKIEDKVVDDMQKLLGIMFESVEAGINAKEPLFYTKPSPIAGNAPKFTQMALGFPYETIDDFVGAIRYVFGETQRFKKDRRKGKGHPSLNESYSKWQFMITAPLIQTRYNAREAEIVLEAKLEKNEVNRDDKYVKALYEAFKKAWQGNPAISSITTQAAVYAYASNEWNARRGLIVAAPTAGACGVIPGVLKAMKEYYKYSDEEIFAPRRLTEALFAAGLIGLLINGKMRMNGGNNGCQAEIGAASAMAAAAATELMGGSPADVMNAVAFALKGFEGLVCDPIGGLVAYPCMIRNAVGAATAITAATLAANKYLSELSPDDVLEGCIDASDKMHGSLKETGKGGLGISTGGLQLAEKLKACQDCKGCS